MKFRYALLAGSATRTVLTCYQNGYPAHLGLASLAISWSLIILVSVVIDAKRNGVIL